MTEKASIAVLGLNGWYEQGVNKELNYTFSRRGGLREDELTADLRIDLRSVLDSFGAIAVLKRPTLDLLLPDNNVRNLFEGCIGCEGTTQGHEWDGDINSLHSLDSVGLNVYLAYLRNQGAIITEVSNAKSS